MLFNQSRAEKVLADRGLDAIISATPENTMYATGYNCIVQWSNPGLQAYSIFSPGHAPRASLVIPYAEVDAITEGNVNVDDFYLSNEYRRGRAPAATMDEVGTRTTGLIARSSIVATTLDGLVAAIESRNLQRARIGVDEIGMSIQAIEGLRQRLPNLEVVYASAMWREIRMIKTTEEIRRIERATVISEEAIRAAFRTIRPGTTERSVVETYRREIVARGADPNYCIIGSGSRSSQPHPLVTDRQIQMGDVVRYDINCKYEYYLADNARAVVLGSPTDEQARIWDALCRGVTDATELVRPGARIADVFAAAMAPGKRLNLDNFDHRKVCGHGIGIFLYDLPLLTLSDSSKAPLPMSGNPETLVENMTLCIEVGYYMQGAMGFLCEDTVVVTHDGCRVLTKNSKSLDLERFTTEG
jgi:Xaa-Pro aminopeptidase